LQAGFAVTFIAGSGAVPSTEVNWFGIGYDVADTNIQVMHNDGSGTATKVDTGMAKPTARDTLYDLYIRQTTAGSVDVTLTRLNDGVSFSTTISTNLPATGALLFTGIVANSNGTTGLASIGVSKWVGYGNNL
jgi:hypothetical protein